MFLLLFFIKPRVRISDNICQDTKDKDLYKVKIVNHSRFMLTNLSYSLYYCVEQGDGIVNITEIKPTKSKVNYLDRKKNKKDYLDNAIRISYNMKHSECPLHDKSKFIFTVFVKHSFSNTTTCIKKNILKEKSNKEFLKQGLQ